MDRVPSPAVSALAWLHVLGKVCLWPGSVFVRVSVPGWGRMMTRKGPESSKRGASLIHILCWFRTLWTRWLKEKWDFNTKNLGTRQGTSANIFFKLYPHRAGPQVCTWDRGWLPAARYGRLMRSGIVYRAQWQPSPDAGVCHLLCIPGLIT